MNRSSDDFAELIVFECLDTNGVILAPELDTFEQRMTNLIDAVKQYGNLQLKSAKLDRKVVAVLFDAPQWFLNSTLHFCNGETELNQKVRHLAEELRWAIHDDYLWKKPSV